MMYHKPTVPRFRIAERVSVSVNNRQQQQQQQQLYHHQQQQQQQLMMATITNGHNNNYNNKRGNTPPNRMKMPLNKVQSPAPLTPAKTGGVLSPKPTSNGSDQLTRQNSSSSNFESRIHEGNYEIVKPMKALIGHKLRKL
ncbi:hypothetical protein TKK_0009330 [Trichogramma kaykai]